MDAAAEIGRNSVCKNQILPEYGDDQADAGRDCRTRLARPNSQAETRTREIIIFPIQLTTSRIGNLTRLIHTTLLAIYVVTIHAYSVVNDLPPVRKINTMWDMYYLPSDKLQINEEGHKENSSSSNRKKKKQWIDAST